MSDVENIYLSRSILEDTSNELFSNKKANVMILVFEYTGSVNVKLVPRVSHLPLRFDKYLKSTFNLEKFLFYLSSIRSHFRDFIQWMFFFKIFFNCVTVKNHLSKVSVIWKWRISGTRTSLPQWPQSNLVPRLSFLAPLVNMTMTWLRLVTWPPVPQTFPLG